MNCLKKIRKCLSVIRHYSRFVNGVSYYPECEHKSKTRILKDQIYNMWRYGYVEEYYFAYGFDRKELTKEKMDTYIVPYRAFLNRTNLLNFQNPYYDHFNGKMTCRVINQDKFYFYLFLSRLGIPTPRVFCFIKNGTLLYTDREFSIDRGVSIYDQLKRILSNEIDAVAKPSDGMMGKGVFLLQVIDNVIYVDGKAIELRELIDILLSANYIIQERIIQHERIDALCPSSVNTIRLQTVMDKNGNVIPFGPLLRIGRIGNMVDNWAKGGLAVGIDENTGSLKGFGFLKPKYGMKMKEHPDTHIVFDGYKIPYYNEAVKMAVSLHQMMYRSHSIGWDIAITPTGPVFIEGNDRWEISLVQAVHGGMKSIEKYF